MECGSSVQLQFDFSLTELPSWKDNAKIYLNRTHISKLTMTEVDGHIISQELIKD